MLVLDMLVTESSVVLCGGDEGFNSELRTLRLKVETF